MSKRLRISRTPTGAAPEHVRRAWVGLELPLAVVASEAWWWVFLEAARPLEAANFVFDASCGEVVE